MTGEQFVSNPPFTNETANAYFEHSTARRVDTNAVLVEAIRREYPQLHLTITPVEVCDLRAFAAAGHAAVAPIDKESDRLSIRMYQPPARRLDGENGKLVDQVLFGKYLIDWSGKEFVVYIADGRDGTEAYPKVTNQYILTSSAQSTERLLIAAGRWTNELHEVILVFDQGYWQKSHELWQSVQSAEWSNVILDEDMKKDLIKDVDNFFDNRETYQKLKVPWKRGVIYHGMLDWNAVLDDVSVKQTEMHKTTYGAGRYPFPNYMLTLPSPQGPPGNGKTISIKAMMHALDQREDPVPTLYVRTLAGFGGPEAMLSRIFNQARRYAPCYLIFEDLDSLIGDATRSYFLNEVDGLRSNDGILMVGSTNHLDRLDPGISKRPSRFDRKYYFPDPDFDQRVAYAKFWQGKLKDNKDVEFPDELCDAVAKITEKFSFAYMQEAFVASLLALAVAVAEESGPDRDLDKLPLWRQLKKQIKNLRDELDGPEELADLHI